MMMTQQPTVGFGGLSADLLLTILNDFLGNSCQDISALDIACAPSARHVFLNAIQNPFFTPLPLHIHSGKNKEVMCRNYVGWLNSRQVQLRELEVHLDSMKLYAHLDPVILKRVHTIVISEPGPSTRRSADEVGKVDILSKCPALKHVEFAADINNQAALSAIYAQFCFHRSMALRSFSFLASRGLAPASLVTTVIGSFGATLETLDLPNLALSREEMERVAVSCTALKLLGFYLPNGVSVSELAKFVDRMPHLKELRLGGMELTVEAIVQLAPHVAHLESLSFLAVQGAVPAEELFVVLLKSCPKVRYLQLDDKCTYTAINGGCTLHICPANMRIHASMIPEVLRSIITACPSPLLELRFGRVDNFALHPAVGRAIVDLAGESLQVIHNTLSLSNEYNPSPSNWAKEDLAYFFTRCKAEFSLAFKRVNTLTDDIVLLIAENCKVVGSLTIDCLGERHVSDGWVEALLRSSGARLTSLRLEYCRGLTNAILQTIVKYCPHLEELAILSIKINTADVIQSIIKPDHLKYLKEFKLRDNVDRYRCNNNAFYKSPHCTGRWARICNVLHG